MEEITERVNKLRSLMTAKNIDAFIVSKPENIFYLSGFSGGSDGRLVITPERQCLLTDSRYWVQAGREASQWELIKETTPGFQSIAGIVGPTARTGIESQYLTVDEYRELQLNLKREPVLSGNLIEALREVKDEDELEQLRQAARISDEVFSQLGNFIKAGLTEKQVANYIVYQLRQKGCEKESFDTIAVSGPNAALPHGMPGSRVLTAEDMLTLDYGGFYHGYAGDMTRTVVIGRTSAVFRERYLQLLEAQQLGVALVKAGQRCAQVDRAVRDCLHKFGLDIYFGHGLGHSVGLEIHEEPRLSPSCDAMLEENMVITVEPGIYIPGWGGIRIEDTVIVKNGGCEVITHSDKGILTL